MTKLHADLEALMPEPAVRCGDYAGPAGEGASEDYFTADQVREAMQSATERAAKVCDSMSGSDYSPAQCAAAIRGTGGGE